MLTQVASILTLFLVIRRIAVVMIAIACVMHWLMECEVTYSVPGQAGEPCMAEVLVLISGIVVRLRSVQAVAILTLLTIIMEIRVTPLRYWSVSLIVAQLWSAQVVLILILLANFVAIWADIPRVTGEAWTSL